MKDVKEHFSLSTFTLEVVLKLPDNMCNGLSSSLCKGGLVLLEEGVQVNLLHQFWKENCTIKMENLISLEGKGKRLK